MFPAPVLFWLWWQQERGASKLSARELDARGLTDVHGWAGPTLRSLVAKSDGLHSGGERFDRGLSSRSVERSFTGIRERTVQLQLRSAVAAISVSGKYLQPSAHDTAVPVRR